MKPKHVLYVLAIAVVANLIAGYIREKWIA